MTFIACEATYTGWNAGVYDYYAGDNRGFGGAGYRTFAAFTLYLDPPYPPGMGDFWYNKDFGTSHGYDNENNEDINTHTPFCTNDVDTCFSLKQGADAECSQQGSGSIDFNHSEANGIHTVTINLAGQGGCTPDGFPAIDAAITMQFKKVCVDGVPGVHCSLAGQHDGFPWYEIYVNDYFWYSFDPCFYNQSGFSLGPPMEWYIPSQYAEWILAPAP